MDFECREKGSRAANPSQPEPRQVRESPVDHHDQPPPTPKQQQPTTPLILSPLLPPPQPPRRPSLSTRSDTIILHSPIDLPTTADTTPRLNETDDIDASSPLQQGDPAATAAAVVATLNETRPRATDNTADIDADADVAAFDAPAPMMALAVPNPPTTPRRVKVYELRNNDWFDRGTGYCTGQLVNVRNHKIAFLDFCFCFSCLNFCRRCRCSLLLLPRHSALNGARHRKGNSRSWLMRMSDGEDAMMRRSGFTGRRRSTDRVRRTLGEG